MNRPAGRLCAITPTVETSAAEVNKKATAEVRNASSVQGGVGPHKSHGRACEPCTKQGAHKVQFDFEPGRTEARSTMSKPTDSRSKTCECDDERDDSSEARDVREASRSPFDANAQRGQNRAGVEVACGEDFDDFESSHPVDPRIADERIEDEGPEILARVHDRGHDVIDSEDE
jgi:hypothetical protein